MFWFAIASLLPAVLLFCACLFGGWWGVLSLCSVSVFVIAADRLAHVTLTVREDVDAAQFAERLCAALGLVHLGLMPLLGFGH